MHRIRLVVLYVLRLIACRVNYLCVPVPLSRVCTGDIEKKSRRESASMWISREISISLSMLYHHMDIRCIKKKTQLYITIIWSIFFSLSFCLFKYNTIIFYIPDMKLLHVTSLKSILLQQIEKS